MNLLFSIAAFCVAVLCHCSALDTVTVQSNAGTFIGYVRTFQGYGEQIQCERFLGIPYAEPPVGNLRFKKPQRKAKLEQAYETLVRKPGCYQLAVNYGGQRKPDIFVSNSVDCLYLNIYRPKGTDQNSKLPVMIFFHGGGFITGTSDSFPGDVFSVYGNVIVVIMNYRLNFWGFLSTGDKNLPGNLGLWDQHVAMQWVHDNIAGFGGDPDSVTIIGISAGAGIVIYHGMFPGNKGLFKRIIANSGSITCPWAFKADPLPHAKKLGAIVGCSDDLNTEELAKCLTGKSDEELYAALNNQENSFVGFPLEFMPTLDGDFVSMPPKDMFRSSSKAAQELRDTFADYDLMIGVTDGEGLVAMSGFAGVDDPETFTINRTKLEQVDVPFAIRSMFGNGSPDILNDLVFAEYVDWNNPDDDNKTRDTLIKITGDYFFNIQVKETADLHSSMSKKNTYYYVLAANPSQHLLKHVSWSNKTNHGEDWVYLLGYDDQDDGTNAWTEPYGQKPQPWELDLSRSIMTMVANFARTGDPNKPNPKSYGTSDVSWPKFDISERQYVVMRPNGLSIERNPSARAFHFWERLLPKVMETVKDQMPREDSKYCDKDGC